MAVERHKVDTTIIVIHEIRTSDKSNQEQDAMKIHGRVPYYNVS